jgi:integrase
VEIGLNPIETAEGTRVMTLEEVRITLSLLDLRERLIVRLAFLAGLRPGETFALVWGRL